MGQPFGKDGGERERRVELEMDVIDVFHTSLSMSVRLRGVSASDEKRRMLERGYEGRRPGGFCFCFGLRL